MAVAELQPWEKMSLKNNDSDSKKTVSQECDQYKEVATEYLVMRDFENCHRTCLNGIAFTKQHLEETCAQTCMESLCVLCIQALAEMNKWPAVLPHVQDTYSGIETCPYTVIQLCILLHAKVQEYSQCYAIASIWLRCKNNIQIPEYKNVVTLYIKHVMMPQDQLVLVPQFLNSCTALTEDEKDSIMNQCEQLSNEITDGDSEQENRLCSENRQRSGTEMNSSAISVKGENRDEDFYKEPRMIVFVKRFGSWLTRHLAYVNLRTLVKVAFLSVGIMLLAKQTISGDLLLNSSRAAAIWEGTVKILKTMFSPYRPGR